MRILLNFSTFLLLILFIIYLLYYSFLLTFLLRVYMQHDIQFLAANYLPIN